MTLLSLPNVHVKLVACAPSPLSVLAAEAVARMARPTSALYQCVFSLADKVSEQHQQQHAPHRPEEGKDEEGGPFTDLCHSKAGGGGPQLPQLGSRNLSFRAIHRASRLLPLHRAFTLRLLPR